MCPRFNGKDSSCPPHVSQACICMCSVCTTYMTAVCAACDLCAHTHGLYVPVCALAVFRDRNKDDVSQILF